MPRHPLSSYRPAVCNTIARIHDLVERVETERSEARALVDLLDRLSTSALLAQLRATAAPELGRAFTEQALAASYRTVARPERSLVWARAALFALSATRSDRQAHYALAFALRGNARRLLGQLDGAAQSFAAAREALLRGAVGELDVLAELDSLEAWLLVERGQTLAAEELFTNAAALWRILGDLGSESLALVHAALLQVHRGHVLEALETARHARRDAPASEPLLKVLAENLLIEVLLVANEDDEAAAVASDETFLSRLPDLPRAAGLRAERLALRGRVALLTHRDDAEELILAARHAFEALGDFEEVARRWVDLAILYLRDNRPADLEHALAHARASALHPADESLIAHVQDLAGSPELADNPRSLLVPLLCLAYWPTRSPSTH